MVALLNQVQENLDGENNTLNMGRRDMFSIIGPNRELQKYLMADTTADASVRASAIRMSGFGSSRSSDEEKARLTETYRQLLKSETDNQVIVASASQLGRMGDKESVSLISDALYRAHDDETIKSLLYALGDIGGQDATQTIEYYQNNGSSEAIRKAAEEAKNGGSRNRGGNRRGGGRR
ncbi:HEAT repeat domain-containing protein [Planctomycetota bacterium]